MHPGGSPANEDTKDEGKANENEANSPVLECHVSERPQPLIHIEAGVSSLIGTFISKHQRSLVVLAFSAIYKGAGFFNLVYFS